MNTGIKSFLKSLCFALGCSAVTVNSAEIRLFKDICFGDPVEKILQQDEMGFCRDVNQDLALTFGNESICRKEPLAFLGHDDWVMVVRTEASKATNVILLNQFDLNMLLSVVSSLGKSGYVPVTIDDGQAVRLDLFSEIKNAKEKNQIVDFSTRFSEVSNDIVKSRNFNLGYVFIKIEDKRKLPSIQMYGNFQGYLHSAAPETLRSVEMRYIHQNESELVLMNFIAPKAALNKIQSEAPIEEF